MTKPTNLFSKKELYQMEHTLKGRSIRTSMILKHRRRKVIYDNMHLMDGMTFTTRHSFPQMLPYNGDTDFELVSFTDRKKHTGKNEALYFFLDECTSTSYNHNYET